MKYLLILSIFSLTLSMSCNDSDCIEGGGSFNDYPLSVDHFNKVSLSGPIDLFVTQGLDQKVLIQAEPEVYGIMKPRVKNSELIIDFENKSCFDSELGVKVHITVPDINQISVSGTSKISSVGDLDLNIIDINVSGESNVEMTGTAVTQSFDVSGDITVQNFDLQAKNTIINLSGSGDLEVNCTELLDIKLSGSATIKYTGQPSIKQDVSGSLVLVDSN